MVANQLFTDRSPCLQFTLEGLEQANRLLYQACVSRDSEEYSERRTHWFHGRYENIYVDNGKLPGLSNIINNIREILDELLEDLNPHYRFGFWLNLMSPGDVTTRHTHDDDDELISGVYYVHTPVNSGSLFLFANDETLEIAPVEGNLVLFSPKMEHEVGCNHSQDLRLSIGFNAG